MNEIIKKLSRNLSLTENESFNFFQEFIEGKVSKIELSTILTLMKKKGENKEEIIGAVKAFLKNSVTFPISNYLFADIVGTGGDKKNTINISTISAIISSIMNCKIAKHCNRSITSKTGSADLLDFLKIPTDIKVTESKNNLIKNNICFLLASNYYLGFKKASIVRKKLNTPTIFNLIGPLLNPFHPPLLLIGVYHKNLLRPMSLALSELKYNRVILVNSHHTDEVTLEGITYISELKNGNILNYQLTPKDFGMNYLNSIESKILNQTNINHFQIAKKILIGKGEEIYKKTIAVNIALLLKLFGYENLIENTKYALETIKSGKAYSIIERLSVDNRE